MPPTLPDRLAAWIRTIWPMLLGSLAAWLLGQAWAPAIVDRLAAIGVHVDQVALVHILGLLLGAAVYTAGRWLEHRTGPGRRGRYARTLGRFLLSIGLPTGQPRYHPTT